MAQILLYGTNGCHLCEEAEQIIKDTVSIDLLDQLRIIDIIDNDELYDQYHLTIPVLTIQPHGIQLHWPFNKKDLIAVLKQTDLN